jgi:hypothetical protein
MKRVAPVLLYVRFKLQLTRFGTAGADDGAGLSEPSEAKPALAGSQEESKPRASRSIKTPLQKEALEAAYNSEPHSDALTPTLPCVFLLHINFI